MIRVISPIRPVRFDDLRAVAISTLVVRGVVMDSSALVLVLAVGTFGSIGWGKYPHGEGGLAG